MAQTSLPRAPFLLRLAFILSISLPFFSCAAPMRARRLGGESAVTTTTTTSASAGGSNSASSGGSSHSGGSLSVIRYQAESRLSRTDGGADPTGRIVVDINITALTQSTHYLFYFTIPGSGTPPEYLRPGFYNSSNKLVADFDTKNLILQGSNTWYYGLDDQIPIAEPFKPLGKAKALVDSGLFTNTTDFFTSVTVNDRGLRGEIQAQVPSCKALLELKSLNRERVQGYIPKSVVPSKR
ncbi:hypothetical protein CLOM_g4505 [Closterium sp. NIES-68]|nr:hypothetical protein CLOM_g4505 [Closterium sp. NIES-68]